jgi:hypothetical protein
MRTRHESGAGRRTLIHSPRTYIETKRLDRLAKVRNKGFLCFQFHNNGVMRGFPMVGVESISFVAGRRSPKIGALTMESPPPIDSLTGDPIEIRDKAALRTGSMGESDLVIRSCRLNYS